MSSVHRHRHGTRTLVLGVLAALPAIWLHGVASLAAEAPQPSSGELKFEVTSVKPAIGSPLGLAVGQQLGLKLEKQTGPLPVIVIDAAKRPDPN